jgi:hypothetical protein
MASTALVPEAGRMHGEHRLDLRSFSKALAQLYWSGEATLCCDLRGEGARLVGDLRRQGCLYTLVDARSSAVVGEVPGGCSDCHLVLRLARTPRIYYYREWSRLMWRIASLHLLQLMICLAERGQALHGPVPTQLLSDWASPDIRPGSIAPIASSLIRGAIDHNSRFIPKPLTLAACDKTVLARRFPRDSNHAVELCSWKLKAPDDLYIAELDNIAPREFLRRRLQEVQALIMSEEKSIWSQCETNLPFERRGASHHKQYGAQEAFQELHPRPVLDFANRARYAHLAALEGRTLSPTTVDELWANRMYSTVHKKGSRALPLFLNSTHPAPRLGVANLRFPHATEGLKSNRVLALDIMHYLAFGTHHWIMDIFVVTFASFIREALLLEFVPLNSPGSVYSADRPEVCSWYTPQSVRIRSAACSRTSTDCQRLNTSRDDFHARNRPS